MSKGRVSKEEQERRIKLLIGFIFTFKYADRRQLEMFIRTVINMTYARRLIAYCLRKGYINDYRECLYKTKIYYLTKKGLDFINTEECFAKDYRFEKSSLGIITFNQHNLAIEAYLQLQKRFNITDWFCAWMLRIGKHRRVSVPDSIIVIQHNRAVALEIETQFKKLSEIRQMVDRYRYYIEKNPQYNAVLMVVEYKAVYESIKKKLFHLAPIFCSRVFILADLEMLKQGRCFYANEVRSLEEAFNLLREGRNGQAIQS